MYFLRMAIALLVSFTLTAAAHELKSGCTYLPKNNLHIPVGLESTGGIDEAAFNRVISAVTVAYEPIVQAAGAKLLVNAMWKSDLVNASATRLGSRWNLNFYGGLARHSKMTEDAFALVVCHELGHHLGGLPKMRTGILGMGKWSSVEGQADYFATMKCFRKIHVNSDHSAFLASHEIPESVKTNCSNSFKSTHEINLCIRSVMAGLSSAHFLWSFEPQSPKPEIDRPDASEVKQTIAMHPSPQCRLDTYVSGSICPVSHLQAFDLIDPFLGTCAEEMGDRFGFRPRCWNKPAL